MKYKYELHSHTTETSQCAQITAKELVEKYKELGYSGIVITNHYSDFTFSLKEMFNKKLRARHYLAGYREAKKYETEDFWLTGGCYDEDGSCSISISDKNDYSKGKTYPIEFEYEKTDKKIKEKLDKYAKTFNEEELLILLNDDSSPIILKSIKDESLIQLILPIKTY